MNTRGIGSRMRIDQLDFDDILFPRVRFRLLNSGTVVAPMLEYRLHVVSAQIDLTPRFHYRVHAPGDGSLVVRANNLGWGDGSLSAVLSEHTVDQLFPIDARTINARIASGASETIVRLSPDAMQRKWQEDLPWPSSGQELSKYFSLGKAYTVESLSDRRYGLPIGSLSLAGHVEDQDRQIHPEKAVLHTLAKGAFHIPGWRIVVHRGGFYTIVVPPRGAAQIGMPDTKYVCVVELDRGSYRRIYKVSRDVRVTETDVFEVIVAARKSCRLQLRFEFVFSDHTAIQSELIPVVIQFGRGERWPYYLSDGIAFQRVEGVWRLAEGEGGVLTP
jgi:hypothetical protein